MLSLSKKIISANRIFSAIVVEIIGKQDLGRDVYAIRTLREVFRYYEYRRPWDKAIKYLFINELPGKHVPAFIIKKEDLISHMEWDQLRQITAGAIVTSPLSEEFKKRIGSWYRVHIVYNGKAKDGSQQAIAYFCHYKIEMKTERAISDDCTHDHFRVKLPDKVCKKYEQKKRLYEITPFSFSERFGFVKNK